MLGEPARRFVVGIDPDLALPLGALLRATVSQPVFQTFASSSSFCASAITFWATCVGTSS